MKSVNLLCLLWHESTQALRDAGANHVASTLAQTREYLGGLEEIPRIPVPAMTALAERREAR